MPTLCVSWYPWDDHSNATKTSQAQVKAMHVFKVLKARSNTEAAAPVSVSAVSASAPITAKGPGNCHSKLVISRALHSPGKSQSLQRSSKHLEAINSLEVSLLPQRSTELEAGLDAAEGCGLGPTPSVASVYSKPDRDDRSKQEPSGKGTLGSMAWSKGTNLPLSLGMHGQELKCKLVFKPAMPLPTQSWLFFLEGSLALSG